MDIENDKFRPATFDKDRKQYVPVPDTKAKILASWHDGTQNTYNVFLDERCWYGLIIDFDNSDVLKFFNLADAELVNDMKSEGLTVSDMIHYLALNDCLNPL